MKIDPKEYFIMRKIIDLPVIIQFLFFKIRRIEKVIIRRVPFNILITVFDLVEGMEKLPSRSIRRVRFKLRILKLLTEIRNPKPRHLRVFNTAMAFQLPNAPAEEKKKKTPWSKRESFYEIILRVLHPLREHYGLTLDYILRNMNFYQASIDGEIIESAENRKRAIDTLIAHPADPGEVRDAFMYQSEGKAVPRRVSTREAANNAKRRRESAVEVN